MGYLRAKIRHFPLRMVPTYGRRYALSLLHRRWAEDGRVATWGPRYPGIDADLRDEGLLTVCARQWRTSVETATRDLDATRRPVLEVRYEDLVARPAEVLAEVASFCGLSTLATGHWPRPPRRSTVVAPAPARARSTPGNEHVLDREIGRPARRAFGYPRPLPTTRRRKDRHHGD